MLFSRTNIKLAALAVTLGIAWGIAIMSVLIAMGMINPDASLRLVNFLKNVGYGIFAGGVIICLVELGKTIVNIVKGDTD